MEKIINKIVIFNVLIFCFCSFCMGQNKDGILLNYALTKKEYSKMEKRLHFPTECLQNGDYRKLVSYDTIYYKTDTLFVNLPDNREYEGHRGTRTGCVNSAGISPSKKVFHQYIPIQTEKRIVVLKCNWYTLIFEKKKGNKYKMKDVYEEKFFDYINSLSLQNKDSVFCNDPLVNPQTLFRVVDYSYVLQEDMPYDIKVCDIKKLKHAYFVNGRITFHDTVFVFGRGRYGDKKLYQDSVVGVHILIPKDSQMKSGEKIKVGRTYSMCLTRYYPYPLYHGNQDCNYNYNFLFGEDVVGLKTACFSYIFTTNNLNGLYYRADATKRYLQIDSLQKDTALRETAFDVMKAIFNDDTLFLLSKIDIHALKSSYNRFVVSYSDIKFNKAFCKQPHRIKRDPLWHRKYCNDRSEFGIVQIRLTDWYEYAPSNIQYDITEYKVIYEKDNLITVRIMWNSTFCKEGLVTYMLIRKDYAGYKLVGLCTYSR